MLFENAKNKTKQGDIGEARAIYEYTRMGYTILKPLTDSDKFDLVLFDGERFIKVQVKTSRFICNEETNSDLVIYSVELKQTGGNQREYTLRKRQDEDYDLLFILTSDGRCWSIPADKLDSRYSVNVGGVKYNEFQIG